MNFFRQNSYMLASVGTGAFLCIMYWRMTTKILQELQTLSLAVSRLQSEVGELKQKVENSTKRRGRPGSGFFSLTSSGDDDDDLYEEAYGGTSDFESLRESDEQIVSTSDKDTGDVSVTNKQEEDAFAQVDKLLEGPDKDKEKAYEILQRNRNKYLTDVEFYWRFSKTTFQMSQIFGAQGNQEKKKQYIYEAKDLAKTALDLDDQCANAHKWFAITIGSVGEYEGTQQKIKNGFLYKEHIEKAIAINPNDPSNHYLLGRWCYSVYMLSWIERQAAATLFATPPSATINETLDHFLKADELNPGKWKDNIVFVAKCYIEKRQYKEAVKWLVKGQQIPVVSQDDRDAETEISQLLTKYKGY